MRRLEEELHEVEGLVVRLGPAAAAGTRGARGATEERPRSGPLRLLEPEAADRGDEGATGAEPGDREEQS